MWWLIDKRNVSVHAICLQIFISLSPLCFHLNHVYVEYFARDNQLIRIRIHKEDVVHEETEQRELHQEEVEGDESSTNSQQTED